VARLGISDPEQFLRRKFREEETRLLFLQSCVLGPALLAQIGTTCTPYPRTFYF
jgi:hypothetical protein